MDSCPCHADCPLGCSNCDSWVCGECTDLDNPQVNLCEHEAEQDVYVCQSECDGNVECFRLCVEVYDDQLQLCPCHAYCPGKMSYFMSTKRFFQRVVHVLTAKTAGSVIPYNQLLVHQLIQQQRQPPQLAQTILIRTILLLSSIAMGIS